MFFSIAPAAYSLTVENGRLFYMRCIKMYVAKTGFQSIPHPALNTFVIKCSTSNGGIRLIALIVSRFPCGRVKIVAPSVGYNITGNPAFYLHDVTFDSVKSLYTVPGLSVITPPGVVYAACGRKSRRIW